MVKAFKVKDLGLASQGELNISWAEQRMPVLAKIRERFAKEKPLLGLRVAACLHVTKETAVLVRALEAAGAEVALCGSNPLSTQDDVAAALAKNGTQVFAWRGETDKQYYWCIDHVLNIRPDITLDDGADLIFTVHRKRRELLKKIIGGQEETTTGVIRLRAMARDGALKYPVIAVNDTPTKWLFDNVFGTGQGTIDSIMRTTNILLAGKNFVVVGYGHCGEGVALRAAGMGANVIVVEVDPVKALRAIMHGYKIMKMKDASKLGDFFITVTGDINAITKEHMQTMKDGAVLANAGHFNVEINVKDLEKLASKKKLVRPNLEEFTLRDGRRLYLIAGGRLCNLAAAEGHPSEVMDQSFSNQALCCEYLTKDAGELKPGVYDVPKEIDDQIAKLELEARGAGLDVLTPEQKKYLASWKAGT